MIIMPFNYEAQKLHLKQPTLYILITTRQRDEASLIGLGRLHLFTLDLIIIIILHLCIYTEWDAKDGLIYLLAFLKIEMIYESRTIVKYIIAGVS